jgi:hypothetical protein
MIKKVVQDMKEAQVVVADCSPNKIYVLEHRGQLFKLFRVRLRDGVPFYQWVSLHDSNDCVGSPREFRSALDIFKLQQIEGSDHISECENISDLLMLLAEFTGSKVTWKEQ